MSGLDWRDIVTITYFSLYLLLLLIISVTTYDSNESNKKWLSGVWKKKSIYTPVIVHIYDTTTDIGVLMLWAQLAFDDNENVDHVDIKAFFYLGLTFLLLYRISSMSLYLCICKQKSSAWHVCMVAECMTLLAA